MVRVGNLFLNVSTLLWAEIRNSPETSSPILSLIYGNAEGNQRFNFTDQRSRLRKSHSLLGVKQSRFAVLIYPPLDTF
jgi:hypothetical protein